MGTPPPPAAPRPLPPETRHTPQQPPQGSAQEATGNPAAASTTEDADKTGTSSRRWKVVWVSILAAVVAVAAVVWGFVDRGRAAGSTAGHGGEESSPWRTLTQGDGGESRRLSSQYESISDVSPRV